ncbi:MAG TPA: TetR/AcrR family transcriptional regulator [Trebonia sp.]
MPGRPSPPPASTPPAPRRPHTGRRRNEAARQAVLDAAAELLGRPEGAATSVEEIAQASGVSKHTIYRWWPSKGAVLLEAMVEQARQEAGMPPEGTSPAGFERFLAATFSAAERAAPLLRSVMAEAQRDPRAAEGMRQFTAARREELRRVLIAEQSRGKLSQDADLDLLIDQVYGLLWYRILIGHAPLNADVAARLARTFSG